MRHAGFSYRELAEALGIAPGSVGTSLARAEAAFEKVYQNWRGSEGGGR
jgi:RNA polymerase sigma-70 factor (ECF subfamily)